MNVDLGGGAALNVFEVPPAEIIGERRRQGGRAIDHYALAVESRATLEAVKERMPAEGAARWRSGPLVVRRRCRPSARAEFTAGPRAIVAAIQRGICPCCVRRSR